MSRDDKPSKWKEPKDWKAFLKKFSKAVGISAFYLAVAAVAGLAFWGIMAFFTGFDEDTIDPIDGSDCYMHTYDQNNAWHTPGQDTKPVKTILCPADEVTVTTKDDK